eukprot:m.6536 g.6536  ORF g.6536 m.6536 type:complete len:53 (-) comp5169_c0_seq2:1205-1363(-)
MLVLTFVTVLSLTTHDAARTYPTKGLQWLRISTHVQDTVGGDLAVEITGCSV